MVSFFFDEISNLLNYQKNVMYNSKPLRTENYSINVMFYYCAVTSNNLLNNPSSLWLGLYLREQIMFFIALYMSPRKQSVETLGF